MPKLTVNVDTAERTMEVLVDGQQVVDAYYVCILNYDGDEPHFEVNTRKEENNIMTRTSIMAKLEEAGKSF